MMLFALIILPLVGAVLAWLFESAIPKSAKWISVVTSLLGVLLAGTLWKNSEEWRAPWFPQWGIEWYFALDGLSFVLLLLVFVMTILASFSVDRFELKQPGLFHALLLSTSSGVIGVLLSMDLFVFFVFWELMLVPVYVMCFAWGGKNKNFATIQFFIMTQVSGLFLLASILLWVFVYHTQTGVYTFDYWQLLENPLDSTWGYWVLFGFLVAFLVKLPAFPFHVWLPPLLAEAPVAPLLIAVMVKTGAYGLLRFVCPLLEMGFVAFTPYLIVLGVIGIVYGAVLAFAQTDSRKVLAYSTLSHMGFILLGILSQEEFAFSGVVVLLVTQALSTGALLMLFSHIEAQTHELDMKKIGGLFKVLPSLTVFSLILIMASIGLPGLGNFIGEWLVLLGIIHGSNVVAICAATSLVLSAIYSLWLVQRLFFGPLQGVSSLIDLSKSQIVIFTSVIVLLVSIGLYPAPLLDIVASSWQSEGVE